MVILLGPVDADTRINMGGFGDYHFRVLFFHQLVDVFSVLGMDQHKTKWAFLVLKKSGGGQRELAGQHVIQDLLQAGAL